MSGALPYPVTRTFPVVAFGNNEIKLSGAKLDLHLTWNEDRKAFECFDGQNKLTSLFPNLLVAPGDVEESKCSDNSAKVLIKSSTELESNVPLFINMRNKKDVRNLFEFLLDLSGNKLRPKVTERWDLGDCPQVLVNADKKNRSREDLDKIVAKYE